MMKKIEEFFERHQKIIGIVLSVVTAVLAFIGSYQYYTQYVSIVPERLWSAIFFSTIKLYGFAPTVGVGNATPACYEVAKWLAPICTLYWGFRAVEYYFSQVLGMFAGRHHRGKMLIAVFGWNKESEQFIKNLIKNEEDDKNEKKQNVMTKDSDVGKRRIILFTDEELEKKERYALQRNKVIIIEDKLFEKRVWDNGLRKKVKASQIDKAVFFYKDSIKNYTLFSWFANCLKADKEQKMEKNRIIRCAIRCEDFAMREVISEYKKNDGIMISIFSIPELAANEMFQHKSIYQLCFNRAKEGVADAHSNNPVDILKNMSNPHVLIAGFGTFGKAMFDETLIRGTLSMCSEVEGYERLRITVIDHEKEKCEQYIRARYPRIDEMCLWKCIDTDMEDVELERELMSLPEATYVAVCFSDQLLNIHAANRLQRYYRVNHETTDKIPFAVRVNLEDEVLSGKKEDIHGCCDVFTFGMSKDILTEKNIFDSEIEKNAKAFHEEYNKASNADKKNQWNELDYIKLESNRAQGKNKPYVMQVIMLAKQIDAHALPEQKKILKNEDVLLKQLETPEYEFLKQMAYLEHGRWCNLYFARGYVGYCLDKKEVKKGEEHRVYLDGEYKQIEDVENPENDARIQHVYYGKIHQCLVSGWEDMLNKKEVRDTIKYDVNSMYVYYR